MKAWDNFLHILEVEVGKATVDRWLRPLRVVKFDACNLYLEAKDSFQRTWFEEHVRPVVKRRLFNNNNKSIRVHLKVAGEEEIEGGGEARSHGEGHPPQPFRMNFDTIDPSCSFNTFVVNSNNEMAAKVLAKVVDYDLDKGALAPPSYGAPLFNPIYLYGDSGSGKTHLLMAAIQALRRQGKNVIYTRCETFTEHVVAAIRAAEMSTFRQAYRSAQALVIDNVHLLSRKGATQEEFFHTFNTLHLANKLILLSADRAPCDLQHIEPRLVSRFEWGISVKIPAYSKEQLLDIVEAKAVALNFKLRRPLAEFLVETFPIASSAIRALEALVLRTHLKEKSPHFSPTTLTTPVVKHLLKDLIIEEEQKAITPELIIKVVCSEYGLATEDLLGKSQSRDCATPRQIAMYLCREELNLPFKKIGDIFKRDHSTVMSSIKRIKALAEEPSGEMSAILRKIVKELKEAMVTA